MLIVRFWFRYSINNEESKLIDAIHFMDVVNKDDPQIKESVEDWVSDFPQWYNRTNYMKYGYEIIEEKTKEIDEIIEKEILITEKKLTEISKRLGDLKAL
jgi:hypothetical protein